jgi:hypothetical protein
MGNDRWKYCQLEFSRRRSKLPVISGIFKGWRASRALSLSLSSETVAGLICDILLYVLIAMMFAVRRDKLKPLVTGLLIVLLLEGAIDWAWQKSFFTDADLSDPRFLNSYRELVTISAITFVGELVLIPFGFWLIQSAGYDLRVVNSTEIRPLELDGPHPLE